MDQGHCCFDTVVVSLDRYHGPCPTATAVLVVVGGGGKGVTAIETSTPPPAHPFPTLGGNNERFPPSLNGCPMSLSIIAQHTHSFRPETESEKAIYLQQKS